MFPLLFQLPSWWLHDESAWRGANIRQGATHRTNDEVHHNFDPHNHVYLCQQRLNLLHILFLYYKRGLIPSSMWLRLYQDTTKHKQARTSASGWWKSSSATSTLILCVHSILPLVSSCIQFSRTCPSRSLPSWVLGHESPHVHPRKASLYLKANLFKTTYRDQLCKYVNIPCFKAVTSF